jgi:hypothetical protein
VGGLILTDCHAGPGQQGPMIIDRAGRLVFFKPLSDGATADLRAFNVRVQSHRGQPVITWWQGAVVAAHGEGHYEIYDQRYRLVAKVQAGNGYQGDLHEFVLTDRGTALLTCYGQDTGEVALAAGGTWQGSYFYGVVQEIDVTSGRVLMQWRSDEHVPLDAGMGPPPTSPESVWDYIHVNSIGVDPSDGNLLISARNTWACYKVDRRTGEVLWTLGGKRSDFQILPGAQFAFQHHVTPHPGGVLTIFDNEGGPPNEAAQSRGLVLRVDERSRQAALIRQYRHRPAVLSPALGSVQELPDGRMFVGWGDSGYFTEYDASGKAVLDGRLAPGTLSYRAFQSSWDGRPPTRPAVAVTTAGSAARLYVSWNGATEHRSWRVLGGARPGRLSALGTAGVAGFETVITVPDAPAWLAVEALNGTGHVLRRSAPVKTP